MVTEQRYPANDTISHFALKETVYTSDTTRETLSEFFAVKTLYYFYRKADSFF